MKTSERKTSIRSRDFRTITDNGRKTSSSRKTDIVDVLDTDEDRVMKYYNTYNYLHITQGQRAMAR